MLRISEIKLSLDSEFSDIENAVAKTLKINKNRILKTEIFKRSIDSRKDSVHFVYTADVTVDGDEDKILTNINNSKVIKCEKYSYKIVTDVTKLPNKMHLDAQIKNPSRKHEDKRFKQPKYKNRVFEY